MLSFKVADNGGTSCLKHVCMYMNVCFNLVQASVNTQRFNFQETKKKKSNCY